MFRPCTFLSVVCPCTILSLLTSYTCTVNWFSVHLYGKLLLCTLVQGRSNKFAHFLRAHISNNKALNPIKLGFKWKLLFSSFWGCPWMWDLDLNCLSFEILRFSAFMWAQEKGHFMQKWLRKLHLKFINEDLFLLLSHHCYILVTVTFSWISGII